MTRGSTPLPGMRRCGVGKFSVTTTDAFLGRIRSYAERHYRSVGSVVLEATEEFLRRKEADKERSERRKEARGVQGFRADR